MAKKQTTIIYRIEHRKDGYGMYAKDDSIFSCKTFEHDDSKHPSPYEDSLLTTLRRGAANMFPPEFNYGFGSVEQLRRWLYNDDWLVWLHDNGFCLAIIKAEEAYVGHTQAVFIKPKKYQKRNIKNFFKLV